MTATREQILFHVGYEWWMFRHCVSEAHVRGTAYEVDIVRNALVEAVATHGRNLCEFFFSNAGHKHDSDMKLDHLGLAGMKLENEPKAKVWFADAAQRVAHLSGHRNGPALDEWPTNELEALVRARIDALKAAIGDKWPTDWLGDCGPDGKRPMGPAGTAGGGVPSLLGATGPRGP